MGISRKGFFMTEFGKDITTFIDAWKVLENEAIKKYPNSSKEELFNICRSAMYHALGIK
jgi:hypothetical protein